MSLDLSLNVQVAHYSLTHNLNTLCSHVPVGTVTKYTSATDSRQEEISLYNILWEADEHCLYTPKDIEPYLITGLAYLVAHYDDLLQYNPSNSWGNIDQVEKVVRKLVVDCKIYPHADLHHCR